MPDPVQRQGYLKADAKAAAAQAARLAEQAQGRLRIGLSWRSGNAQFGAQKSLALADCLPLLRQPAFWIDLQYGDTAGERATLENAYGISLWHDEAIDPLKNLDAAAAQYAALDLVITASNTTAHLAGALGLPVWLLLPAPGFGLLWYWFRERQDSPYYPGLRCFRQKSAGDWSAPVSEAAAALQARFANPSLISRP